MLDLEGKPLVVSRNFSIQMQPPPHPPFAVQKSKPLTVSKTQINE